MQSSLLNPGWLAGLFDACGWLGISNTFRPSLYICFRSRHRETFAFPCHNEEGWRHPIGVETRGVWWHWEVHGERVLEILQAIRDFSPVNKSIAEAGLALLEHEKQYDTDPRAILIGRKIAEKISEVSDRDYPI
jgi:hypothetical protein